MDVDWDLVDATMHSAAAASSSGRSSRQDSQPPKSDREKQDERNMQLAVHHATLLQQRKDIEASNLQSTIALIDFPLSGSADPANPDPAEAEQVKTHMQNFQPANLEELVVERNIEGKCGYVLCARPYADERRHRGKFAILQKGQELKMVKTRDLMKWCSPECARRAMYIRAQLDEKPAWERAYSDRLQLYGEGGEDGNGNDDDGATGMDPSNEQAVAKMAHDLRRLALERGNPNVDGMMNDFQKMKIPYR